jgi:hypothetical protein
MVDRFIDDIILSVKLDEDTSIKSRNMSQGNQGEQAMEFLRKTDIEK